MYYQVLNLTHTLSVTQPRQPALHSYPYCLVWCGSAAPGERHCHTWATTLPRLKWLLGLGVLIPFPFLPNVSLLSPTHSARPRTEECPSLSPPLVTLSSQAFPLIYPSILERKRSQTWLESRSFDSPTQKSTWFTFWPVVVFITLGALLLAG